MKALITHLKSWLIIILSGTLVLMFIFACSAPPEKESTTTTTTTGGGSGDDDDEDDDEEREVVCALPTCSGSKCCDKKNKDCIRWCEDDLDLSGDAKTKCLTLDEDFVDSLAFLFSNKALKDPDEDKLLKEVEDDDIPKICAAVRDLDVELLEDLIEDYDNDAANTFLGWMAHEKQVVQIFKQTKDKEDGIKMVKDLLDELDSSSNDQGVVDGLAKNIDFDDDDDQNLLELALDKKNDDLVQFIHREVLKDKKEGICGSGSESNWPNPKPNTSGASDVDAGYDNQATGSDGGYAEANQDSNKQKACLLAVYCFKVAEGASEDDLREDLAEEISDNSIEGFIKDPLVEGGLGLTAEDQSEKWPNAVCVRLGKLWNDGSGLTLGLG